MLFAHEEWLISPTASFWIIVASSVALVLLGIAEIGWVAMLAMIALLILFLLVAYKRQASTDWDQRIERFIASRSPQTDREFLMKCEVSPEQESDAIGIRKGLATLGKIPTEYLHADDYFYDLEVLPFWSSRGDVPFDMIGVLASIEKEFSRPIPPDCLESIANPDVEFNLEVRVFVQEFLAALQEKSRA